MEVKCVHDFQAATKEVVRENFGRVLLMRETTKLMFDFSVRLNEGPTKNLVFL